MKTKLHTLAILMVVVGLLLVAAAPSQTPLIAGRIPCTDPLGCVFVPSGRPIHIAYLLVSASWSESKNGAEVAIDDSGGMILGHSIQWDGVNGGDCDPDAALSDAKRMARDRSIVAVIGTACSPEAKVVVPVFSARGFSMVSPSNTFDGLTEPGHPNQYPGYFRVVAPDKVAGPVAAQYARNILGLTKAATINDGSEYSVNLEQAFVDEFTALGGTISARETITDDQMDMTVPLTAIASDNPGMVYFPVQNMSTGSYIINQARATSGLETVVLMGGDRLFGQEIVFTTGPDVDGFLVAQDFDTEQFSPAYSSVFVPAYTAKFGSAPSGIFAAHGYDAFNVIKAAIVSSAIVGADGSLSIGRQALRTALYSTTGFPGLTGKLTCSPTGDCGEPSVAIYQYHTGVVNPTRIWP